jgi:hypothetical protein
MVLVRGKDADGWGSFRKVRDFPGYIKEEVMRKGLLLFVVFVVAAAFLNPLPALAAAYQDKPKAVKKADPAGQLMMITGTIESGPDGYFIRGQVPKETFRILNPNDKVLAEVAKAGKAVKIEARSVQGDNVNIQKIDGKFYLGGTVK